MRPLLLALVTLGGCCLQATPEGAVDSGTPDAGVPDSGPIPIQNSCLVLDPPGVGFGTVAVNTTAMQSYPLKNQCDIDISVTLGDIQGANPLLFQTAPSAGNLLVLHHQQTTYITVEYAPLVVSQMEDTAYFAVKACSSGGTDCEPKVTLQGIAVSSCLAIEPTSIDFGFAPPGTSIPKFVTLSNGCAPIHLTAEPVVLNTDASGANSTVGAFQPGAGFPTKDTVIAPGQSIQIPVVFTPPTSGSFIGELEFSTDDATSSHITIPLTGLGGGAVISCTPKGIDFGLDAVGIGTTLPIVCVNVGTDIPGHPEANLFIPDPNSNQKALTVQGGDPAFQPSLPSFPPAGLAVGESVQMYMEYLPTVAGTNSDTLAISSNGAGGSDTLIPLTGQATALPDCNFRIDPTGDLLDFGTVNLGSHANLSFDIVNQGTNDCVANSFQTLVPPNTPNPFGLPDFVGTPNTSLTIPGNDHARINVRFTPHAIGVIEGSVNFVISNSATQQVGIAVRGTGQ